MMDVAAASGLAALLRRLLALGGGDGGAPNEHAGRFGAAVRGLHAAAIDVLLGTGRVGGVDAFGAQNGLEWPAIALLAAVGSVERPPRRLEPGSRAEREMLGVLCRLPEVGSDPTIVGPRSSLVRRGYRSEAVRWLVRDAAWEKEVPGQVACAVRWCLRGGLVLWRGAVATGQVEA